MKKTFIIIAMAGILTAITGCGKTDSGITSDNKKGYSNNHSSYYC